MLVPRTIHQGNALKTFISTDPFEMESGRKLNELKIGYHTYGSLNEDKSNVIWVFHALTGNSDPADWWSGLVGDDRLITPKKYFIVCVNMLGSCYGSTIPPKNYLITIKDIVGVNRILCKHLGIQRIKLGIGGSMGGQQVLQWAAEEPELFETIVPIAANAIHSPWGIAFNEAQRMALEHPDENKGMAIARAVGMLSYRHYAGFEKTQKDTDDRLEGFSASSYQRYQGKKLMERFNNRAYHHLSRAMDSHNLGRYFGGIENALSRIQSNCLSIGVDTDLLFPVHEQQLIAKHIKKASFHMIRSDYGHDGFLLETYQINEILKGKI